VKIGEWFVIPTSEARKRARSAELARARKARYDAKRVDKNHGKGLGSHHGDSRFLAWDGEGPRDAGYALFGNSDGDRIRHPFLSTRECLDLILETKTSKPDTISIWFGGNYDVSMILKDLSWRHLSALHNYNSTMWREYELEHVPHKWFKVKRGTVSCTIYDIRSFFAGDYVSCLNEFDIGTADQRLRIATGKDDRDKFVYAQIENIEAYWRLELSLMPVLAEKLRSVFRDAGYVPRSWHGPGALARMALQRHKVYDAMARCPADVRIAAQYAFAGGRFEDVLAGHIKGTIYGADIHSAYPHFATLLPNLARGKWRHTRNFEPGKFAVWYIDYSAKPDPYRIYPLFRRMGNGSVAWPHRTSGWYWQPEAELVWNDPDAQIREGWVFDEEDSTDRPFAFLEEYYNRRARLKRLGNPAEYTFKLIINSIYGQLAQRVGWNRKTRMPPKSHQLEWAGFITSACRAAVYKVARNCGDKLVSIDTDGVYSLSPFTGLQVGNNLGEWELEEYDDGIFWQSGIYTLRIGDEWKKAKTRGIPKGSYTAEELLECLRTNQPLRLTKKVFVTYGLADSGQRENHNKWLEEPHEFAMGGSGKRIHFPRACNSVCGSADLHKLAIPTFDYGPQNDPESKRHYLPWQDRADENLARIRLLLDDLSWYDANDLDPDDMWVRSM
jgi:hypothetical protein